MNKHASNISLDSVVVRLEGAATESGKFRTISAYEEFHPGLTDAGLVFLSLCDGIRTLKIIAEILVTRFEIEEDGDGEKAVMAFCEYLTSKDLVRVI